MQTAGRPPRSKGIMLPNLRRERHRAGLSLRDLAQRSGVKHGTISEIETGHRGAQARTVRKLAEALEVSTRELVG